MFWISKGKSNSVVTMKIKGMADAEKRAIRKAFYDIGKDLVDDAREEINKTPKSGRQYTRYYGSKGRLSRGRVYTASAPGEAPANITGGLRNSIDFTVNGSSQMEFGVDAARHGVFYGKFLEYENLISFSGQGSKNIKPRPFISAAYKKNMSNIAKRFQNAISAAIK